MIAPDVKYFRHDELTAELPAGDCCVRSVRKETKYIRADLYEELVAALRSISLLNDSSYAAQVMAAEALKKAEA